MKLKSKYFLLAVVGMGSLSLCAADTKVSTEVKTSEKKQVAMTESAVPVKNSKASDTTKQTANKQTVTLADVAGRTDLNIKFVEPFDAMRKCSHGDECGKKLQDTRAQLAKGIHEDEQRIARLEAEFQTKASSLSLMARETSEKELRKLKADYSSKLQESEHEMKLAMHTSAEELSRDMEVAVARIAQRDGVDVVLDMTAGRSLYVNPTLNITADVIKEMNVDYQVKLAQAKNSGSTVKVAANAQAPTKKVATVVVDSNKSTAKA